MRIRSTVVIMVEHEVSSDDYKHIGETVFLKMDKKHIEKYPGCLLDMPNVKVVTSVEKIKDES